jgi:hypothetical protein
MNTKPFDVVGLAAISVATIHAAVLNNEGALLFGGFTILVYTCMLFFPGMGGRLGAIAIIPLMGLFTIAFVMLVGEVWSSIVMVIVSSRAGMLLLQDMRQPSTPMLK